MNSPAIWHIADSHSRYCNGSKLLVGLYRIDLDFGNDRPKYQTGAGVAKLLADNISKRFYFSVLMMRLTTKSLDEYFFSNCVISDCGGLLHLT